MQRFALSLVLALSAPLLACDGSSEPTQLREAPDVPWPAVQIAGPLKSPASLTGLLAECFVEVDYDHGTPPSFTYEDEVPDGDDQQPAQLCVEWEAHLDVADCVRRGLIDLGGEVAE